MDKQRGTRDSHNDRQANRKMERLKERDRHRLIERDGGNRESDRASDGEIERFRPPDRQTDQHIYEQTK